MCGIFGYTGEMNDPRVSMLLQMLCIVGESRGKHSTGLLLHETPYRSKLIKRALTGSKFVSEGNTEVLHKVQFTMALGHNRQATKGAVNDRNAHPFPVKVGNQWDFGVHNGTATKASEVAKKFKIKEADVDSETCLRAIAGQKARGVPLDEAIENLAEFISLEADFAFAYIDSVSESLYLWRNIGRPMQIIDARPYGMGRWFCSTKEIFLGAWGLLRGFLPDPKDLVFFEAYPYRLYKVSVDGIFEVDGIRELKHKVRPAPTHEPEEYFCGSYTGETTFGGGPRCYRQGNLRLADEDGNDFSTDIDGNRDTPDSPERRSGHWSGELRKRIAERAGADGIKGLSGGNSGKTGNWYKDVGRR